MIRGLVFQVSFRILNKNKNMPQTYYQVLLKTGKVHPSLYINPQTAIRKVGGIENVKEIRAIRAELVEAQYNEVTGKINIE